MHKTLPEYLVLLLVSFSLLKISLRVFTMPYIIHEHNLQLYGTDGWMDGWMEWSGVEWMENGAKSRKCR